MAKKYEDKAQVFRCLFRNKRYTATLGGNGQSFSAPRLDGISGETVYRMDNPPTIEGQAYKEISMEWIEV